MPTDTGNTVALAVDLDGTLVRSDLFVESILSLIRQNPFALFAMLGWLMSGRATLKHEVAKRVSVDPAALPYLDEVVAFVRAEHAAGRQTVLATGCDMAIARPVADLLGCFDEVVASDGEHNRTGNSKKRRLTDLFGPSGFDYIGNSKVDLPVWENSRLALLAARSPRQGRALAQRVKPERVFYYPPANFSQWARLLHLRQWAWNLLVFLPLPLLHVGAGSGEWRMAALAYMAMNLWGSGALLGVDLLNICVDRKHPGKRDCPLPAGRIYLLTACVLVPLLLAGGVLPILLLPAAAAVAIILFGLVLMLWGLWENRRVLAALALLCLCALRLLAGMYSVGFGTDNLCGVLPL